jgi:hypothetical protein
LAAQAEIVRLREAMRRRWSLAQYENACEWECRPHEEDDPYHLTTTYAEKRASTIARRDINE